MRTHADNCAHPSFEIEHELLHQGYGLIAGADETGRGALAGPLCVGLVIYDPAVVACPHRDLLSYINDSKKLSPKQRSKALAVIGKHAACVATAMVSHRTVDRLNINGATEYALRRLLAGLGVKPDVVLMDGTFKFRMDVPVIPIPAGDARSVSIASASIAAKLRRDAVMDKLDSLCPGYGLRNNKGYGTLYHRTRIFNLGPSALHRRTYEPVKGLLCGEGLFDDEDR